MYPVRSIREREKHACAHQGLACEDGVGSLTRPEWARCWARLLGVGNRRWPRPPGRSRRPFGTRGARRRPTSLSPPKTRACPPPGEPRRKTRQEAQEGDGGHKSLISPLSPLPPRRAVYLGRVAFEVIRAVQHPCQPLPHRHVRHALPKQIVLVEVPCKKCTCTHKGGNIRTPRE
jgi:hypothetical protein